MGSRRTRSAFGIAALVVGLVLGGCAAAPSPDDDVATPLPTESWNPGVGDSDGVVVDAETGESPEADGSEANDGEFDEIYATFTGFPDGTLVALLRKDANCVREEREGVARIKGDTDLFMMRVFRLSPACEVQSSWATWTMAVTPPDGKTWRTTLELAEDGVGGYDTTIVAKCWNDDTPAPARCEGSTKTMNHSSEYFKSFHLPVTYHLN